MPAPSRAVSGVAPSNRAMPTAETIATDEPATSRSARETSSPPSWQRSRIANAWTMRGEYTPGMPDELPEPGAVRTSLERVHLRLREQKVTLSGWRLELESPRGKGAVVVAEKHYRGEGICMGMPQEKLAAIYAALLPPEEPSSGNDSIQFG